jgi:hypothetical protein
MVLRATKGDEDPAGTAMCLRQFLALAPLSEVYHEIDFATGS